MTGNAAGKNTLTGASLIGSRAVHGSHGQLRARNPRTGAELEPVYGLIGADVVDRAATLAWEAFASYRATSPAERAAFLETVAANIDDLGNDLIDLVVAETGKDRPAVQGEAARTTGQLRLFAIELLEGSWHGVRIDPAQPDRLPRPRPDIRLRKVPLGPVAVFGASNFPLAFSVAGGDTASALAAGCPVVVKAHGAHPGTSELVGRAIQAAVAAHGLHEGVFSLLFGSGNEVGIALVSHPRIKAVGFTGSRTGGMALVQAAALRAEPIPVYAEMSSINPVFIMDGALRDHAEQLAEGWVGSVLMGAGQLCTSPGLVFVPDNADASRFVDAAAAAISKSVAAPMLNKGIADSFGDASARLREKDGVATIGEGAPDDSVVVCGVPQLYVTDAATFLADDSLHNEMFGPASLVIKVTGGEQMVEILQGLEGQLTATIHTVGDEPGVARLVEAAELRVGRILFNGWPTGVEVTHAMVHGGPFPATSNSMTTSVGTLAIDRFLRPVSYQNVPAAFLPEEVQDVNPLNIPRRVDGLVLQAGSIGTTVRD